MVSGYVWILPVLTMLVMSDGYRIRPPYCYSWRYPSRFVIIPHNIHRPTFPEENQCVASVYLMEGDVQRLFTRNAVQNKKVTWLTREIPYTVDSSYNSYQLGQIRIAMDHFRQRTNGCITFHTRTNERDYIHITPGDGCYSRVGRQGGAQLLSIGSGCDRSGTIMHELMHALGFWHEHNRPDRNQYISITWDNIANGHRPNFDMNTAQQVDTLDIDYDYESIMHYAFNTFAINRAQPTITPRNTSVNPSILGQRERLSDLDVLKIRRLYKCDIETCLPMTPLMNGQQRVSGNTVGSTASFMCNRNYFLVGANQSGCVDTGRWSGAKPMCMSKQGAVGYCSFESSDLCGWVQGSKDNWDWRRSTRATATDNTGPTWDHTLCDSGGVFLYLESSSPARQGDKARLTSPSMTSSHRSVCVIFYYHMYGSTMGSLTLYTSDGRGDIPIWRMSGNKGDNWRVAVIENVAVQSNYKVRRFK
ncbi:hypothetical protein ScPMuIL_004514 [Solemya velum]